MLREHDKEKKGFYPWAKNVDYDKFVHSKHTNFDFDEYFYVTPSVKSCNLTAEITKNKGEKVTEEDLNDAFATSLFVAMTGFDFNQETAQNYFTTLPPEFYTKEAYDKVCDKLLDFIEQSPKFERQRLERNLFLFQEFAHKANEEEIPAPQSQVEKSESKNF